MDAAILRTGMGSSVQLPSYFLTKNFLVNNGYLASDNPWTYVASSSVSGVAVVSSFLLLLFFSLEERGGEGREGERRQEAVR